MIGARTMGASARALDLSLAFASERRQFGQAIVEFQAIEFMLADMAAEIMAATSLLYRVCWEAARGGASRKETHAMASAVKLVCSETAGRVIDRAVQIFGGRGYMREQPVERLYRELRVDRIWEGTSEIQRVVIGNELRKRGAGRFTRWPTATSERDLEQERSQGRVDAIEEHQQRVGQRERARGDADGGRPPGASTDRGQEAREDRTGAQDAREPHGLVPERPTMAQLVPVPRDRGRRPNLQGPQDGTDDDRDGAAEERADTEGI